MKLRAALLSSLSLLIALPTPAFAQAQPLPAPTDRDPAAVPQSSGDHPIPPPSERAGRVTVTVDSTKPNAVLERRTATVESMGAFFVIPTRDTETKWEPVCVTPCKVDLDRYSSYRIRSDNGITGVSAFTLPQGQDALRLNVDAGDLKAHRLGQTLTTVGIAAVIVGSALLLSSTSFKHEDDARLAGYITGGAGILAVGVGIPLALLTTTKVKSDDKPTRDISFLPRKVKLFGDLTLTQKGIVF